MRMEHPIGPDSAATPGPSPSGTAGASARREYERRKANDEARLREEWGRFGGIVVALAGERQPTRAWAVGAAGEERLGTRLDVLESATITVLHDRRIPGSKANIDHIVVTPAGVWVIDAKHYAGRPALRVQGGLLRPRVETLVVGRRDCTKLVDGVRRQVDVVRRVVGDVPVQGALCFVGADWPMIGGAFAIDGVEVLWPKRLVKRLASDTGAVDVAHVRELIVRGLRPA